MWAPAQVGRSFDLSTSALSPLEPFKDHLTIISNTDVRNAEAFELPEIGGDHFRSSAVFLTQMHPRQTQGSDVLRRHLARPVLRAEVRAGHADPVDAAVHRERRSGRRLLLRLLLCLHRLDQLGVARRSRCRWCATRAPCSISCSASARAPSDRAERRAEDRSILDWIASDMSKLKSTLGASDRARLSDYLDDLREIERRIERVEAYNSSGAPRELARSAGRRS